MAIYSVRMDIEATIRAQRDPWVMQPQVRRGLELVTNPDRDDDGLLAFDLSVGHHTLIDASLTVSAPSPEEAEEVALFVVKRGLDRVTNHLRTDDGLKSFALCVTGVEPAPEPGGPRP